MKDIVLAIVTRLKANTTLCHSSYVGASPSQRIYRGTLPQVPTWPCIVVHRIDGIRDPDPNYYGVSRVQVSAYAKSEADADTISELVADDLNGITNTSLLTGAAGSAVVYVISVDDAGTAMDSNAKMGVFMYHRDFLIDYSYR